MRYDDLKVGDKFEEKQSWGTSVREIIEVQVIDGRKCVRYSHNGTTIDSFIPASMFSPGWKRVQRTD